jgi:hypothetical protein
LIEKIKNLQFDRRLQQEWWREGKCQSDAREWVEFEVLAYAILSVSSPTFGCAKLWRGSVKSGYL